MKVTQGKAALVQSMQINKTTQVKIAKLLQVTQQTVSGWVTGFRRPNSLQRLKIEKFFSIPANAWLTEDEQKLLQSMRTENDQPPPPEAA